MPPSYTNISARSSAGTIPRFIGAVEDQWELFSDDSSDYTIGAPIGFGASSIVYSAQYRPKSRPSSPMPCALKVLDLDSLPPHSLSLLQRETTLMSLSKHPNVLRVRGSWIDGHRLYIALRLMNKGSAADVMRYGWPGGLEEEVIKCILRQALQGLNYLHVNGFIHRDVKAANLLIDDDGTVLLGDLGVAADLSEDTSRILSHPSTAGKAEILASASGLVTGVDEGGGNIHNSSAATPSTRRVVVVDPIIAPSRPKIGKRKSFVGTPCWMAPELIQGKQYDSSADIWSFGITALELTQGRPPRSRESPSKVLLKTIQEAPPTLDREGGAYKYSRAFQEMVESCLIKDPSKRPTAEQLLQTSFFKGTKKQSYLIGAILKDLPPLASRQERRVLSSTQLHNSVDSWDFATTVHSAGSAVSPTSTLSRLRALERIQDDAVYETDAVESVELARHMTNAVKRGPSSSSSNSRRISWALESPIETSSSSKPADAAVLEQENDAEEESDLDIQEAEIVPSDSTSSSPLSASQRGSSPGGIDSTDEPRMKSVVETSGTVPIPVPVLPKHTLSHSSSASSLPVSSSPTSAAKKSKVSSSPSQGGLWNKIKGATTTNVKRAASFSSGAKLHSVLTRSASGLNK